MKKPPSGGFLFLQLPRGNAIIGASSCTGDLMEYPGWRLARKVLATLLLLFCAVVAFLSGFGFNIYGRVFLIFLLPCFLLSLGFLYAIWRLWKAPARSIFACVMITLGAMWLLVPLGWKLYQTVIYRDFGTPIAGHANAIELVYQGYPSRSDHVFSLGYALASPFSELRIGDDLFVPGTAPQRYLRKAAGPQRPRYKVIERLVTPPEKSWSTHWPGRGDVEMSVIDTTTGEVIGRWNGPTKGGWRGPMASAFLVDLLRPSSGRRVLREDAIPGTVIALEEASGNWPGQGRIPLSGCPEHFSAHWDTGYARPVELHAGNWSYGGLQGESSVVCNAEGIFIFSFSRPYAYDNIVEFVQLADDGKVLAQALVKLPQLDPRLKDLMPMVQSVERRGGKLALRTLYRNSSSSSELRYIAEVELPLTPGEGNDGRADN